MKKRRLLQELSWEYYNTDDERRVTMASLRQKLLSEAPAHEEGVCTPSSSPEPKKPPKLRSVNGTIKLDPQTVRGVDLKIMVVDDEKKIADLYSLILRAAGFTVNRIAHDGVEAVNAISSDPKDRPDVILMDQKMPRMDGLEASKKIKEINPDIKIIMITAYDVLPTSYKGLLSFVLSKPISKQRLIEAIQSV